MKKLYVNSPNIGNVEHFKAGIDNIFKWKQLTNDGEMVKNFEFRIESLLNVNHCIATCNGTMALQLAIKALGLTGEVIVPSFTFIATVSALKWQGIKPVFCDIEKRTHSIDITKIAELVTPETTGILAVNMWGMFKQFSQLKIIAKNRKLKLLYDSSHAFDCTHEQRPIGNFGDMETFSFHATKFINTFEGGAVTTNSSRLAKRLRRLRNFGFSEGEVIDEGINGKMPEICALMGRVNLNTIYHFRKTLKENYQRYVKNLSRHVKILEYDLIEQNNYQYVIIEVIKERRKAILNKLRQNHVLAKTYFHPGIHKMKPYFDPNIILPITEEVTESVIVLPNNLDVSLEDVDRICKIVRETFV